MFTHIYWNWNILFILTLLEYLQIVIATPHHNLCNRALGFGVRYAGIECHNSLNVKIYNNVQNITILRMQWFQITDSGINHIFDTSVPKFWGSVLYHIYVPHWEILHGSEWITLWYLVRGSTICLWCWSTLQTSFKRQFVLAYSYGN